MQYFFYGEECPHCHTMKPLVEKLNEEGKNIQILETWHNEENAKKQKEFDKDLCGGVPFFYDDEDGRYLCGATTEERLTGWVNKQDV